MTDHELLKLEVASAENEHVVIATVDWDRWNPFSDNDDALRIVVNWVSTLVERKNH